MLPSSLLEAAPLGLTIVKTLLIATALLWAIHLTRRQSKTRPPGPMGLPLVGNVFDLPGSREAENIAALGAKYGEGPLAVFSNNIVFIYAQGTLYIWRFLGSLSSCLTAKPPWTSWTNGAHFTQTDLIWRWPLTCMRIYNPLKTNICKNIRLSAQEWPTLHQSCTMGRSSNLDEG